MDASTAWEVEEWDWVVRPSEMSACARFLEPRLWVLKMSSLGVLERRGAGREEVDLEDEARRELRVLLKVRLEAER